MAFFKKTKQAAPNASKLQEDKKKQKRVFPFIILTLLALLAISSTLIFYHYLNNTLFQERNSHFVEISDKVTQLVESVVQHYRTITSTAKNLLLQSDLEYSLEIPDHLKEIQTYFELEEGSVLAFDNKAKFYVSDGTISNWREADILSNGKEQQELVTALDYRADDNTYILFVKKLDEPLEIIDTQITHIGIAVDSSVFQKTFDMDIFQEQSYVSVINSTGRRLYHYEQQEDFIHGYNLLTALEPYPFIHGGTLEDLRYALKEQVSAGYEFNYKGEPYFVAVSPVSHTDWFVLTFVPTKILGAATTIFLNTVITYISAIAMLVVLMMGVIMFFFITKQGDKRLIEHQRKANVLLQDAADAANAASIAKSDFLSHMSHDIRTPINGIMGMTDIALKNLGNPDKILDCLKKIEGSSGHLLSLVNDVLDMSRIESGKTQVSSEPIDMRQVIEHCASIIGGQLQGRDIELIEEFEPLSYPYVFGDELHLRQVLINILGNAVKFTPDGGKIYFRTYELASDETMVRFCFEVEDTGIGMKPEFIPKIFEPFVQEDDGTRSSYKGTGLGMAITKKFVDLMGGTIRLESQLHIGSRFIVELPCKIDKETRDTPENECNKINLSGIRLLLVEDNELNIEIAQYLLEYEGILVTPVTDGKAALDTFSESQPGTFDGILMDVMMPVMDGLSATRAIRALERKDAKTIPIIAMTANAYDEDKRHCLEAGMNAHIAKPIDGTTLFQVLTHYIPSK